MSRENVGIVFMDSISFPCIDEEEEEDWVGYPPVCNDGSHEESVLVMFALDGNLWKSMMTICKFIEL